MTYRIATSLLLVSCTAATMSPGTLRIAKSEDVATCESVGVIEERIESASEATALKEQVRDTVKERAIKLKASDLVIIKEESEPGYAYVHAEAYRCKR